MPSRAATEYRYEKLTWPETDEAAEKGQQAVEEAVRQLVRFVDWFAARPKDQRKDKHRRAPTMPIPWGQQPLEAE